jgi:MoxR-like ATPase
MAERLAAVPTDARAARARALTEKIVQEIASVILGKPVEIKLAVACLLARGHLLIEDVPGVGKTLMARSLAAVLGLSFRRIQFTSDLLPADIIGVSIFNRETGAFEFRPGPIFAHVILADEVNRATPKAQSALLEAMEEQQTSIDGITRALPDPFFVIATQNPIHQIGTFALPESQLDRFLMRIAIGYPPEQLERKLLRGDDRRELVKDIRPAISGQELVDLQKQVGTIHVADALLDYAQALVRFTRQSGRYQVGLSPRAAVDLVTAARAWALIEGRQGVYPEDLQTVFPAVASHRLQFRGEPGDGVQAVRTTLDSVGIP